MCFMFHLVRLEPYWDQCREYSSLESTFLGSIQRFAIPIFTLSLTYFSIIHLLSHSHSRPFHQHPTFPHSAKTEPLHIFYYIRFDKMGIRSSRMTIEARLITENVDGVDTVRLSLPRSTGCVGRRRRSIASFTFRKGAR